MLRRPQSRRRYGGAKMPLSFLLLSAALAAAAPPESPPDPLPAAEARGHAFARQVCASCHAVEGTGQSPDKRAPTFLVSTRRSS